jgi:hypothetical protein
MIRSAKARDLLRRLQAIRAPLSRLEFIQWLAAPILRPSKTRWAGPPTTPERPLRGIDPVGV